MKNPFQTQGVTRIDQEKSADQQKAERGKKCLKYFKFFFLKLCKI